MHKNFAEILREAGVDIDEEYQLLESIVFDCLVEESLGRSHSLYSRIADCFLDMDIRGTCISLDGFNARYGFSFEQRVGGRQVTLDELVAFCEYVHNLCSSYLELWADRDDPFDNPSLNYGERYDCAARALRQVLRIIDKIGYRAVESDGFTVFVGASASVNRVAAALPGTLSYELLLYGHHSLRGDVERKRAILSRLANELEPKRAELQDADKKLSENLFFAFNNFGIRHSNLSPESKHFQPTVAALPLDSLESLYDDVYDQCLVALLKLDALAGADRICALRSQMKSC